MRDLSPNLREAFPSLRFLTGESLSRHVTFRTGGPADILAFPENREEFLAVASFCRNEGFPLFVLGGGSNLLVADRGIRGVVLSTAGLSGYTLSEGIVTLGAGEEISAMALRTAREGLSGLHFFHGMPGSVGGAVYMNARCYGGEIADAFLEAAVWDGSGVVTVPKRDGEWSYKRSPFQSGGVILGVRFRTPPDDPEKLVAEAVGFRRDREEKGHYRAPCAGSVFKNDRAFGEPSGAIIDRCGLKGLTLGGAAVSAWHANIIVNTGGASSSDILGLIRIVREKVAERTGFFLEPEVIPVGEWENADVAGP